MQRQFFSNLILTLFLNLLIKPIAIFAIDATVQNRVGQEEYGLYFTLLNLTVIFNIFLDFILLLTSIISNVSEAPS